MDRTTWLEARRKGIGGSDAAAILGLSKYRTAIDVWEDKLGLVEERPQTAAMAWGLRLEDAIATAYTEETGIRLRRPAGIRRARHVKAFPMLGSIDRLATDRIVELKKRRTDDGLHDDGPPELRVPPDWYCQTQHYLEVVDLELADVAVLVGGTDFRIIPVPRDRAFGADLIDEETAFWTTYIVPEVQPPVTGDDLAFLQRRFPLSTDDEKVATPELALMVDAYLAEVDQVEAAEHRRDDIRAVIEERMGDTARLIAPSATVSWKSHERRTIGWKEYAGSLERIVDELADHLAIDPMTGHATLSTFADPIGRDALPFLPTTPAEYGPGLDGLRNIYSATSTARPFVVRKPKEA